MHGSRSHWLTSVTERGRIAITSITRICLTDEMSAVIFSLLGNICPCVDARLTCECSFASAYNGLTQDLSPQAPVTSILNGSERRGHAGAETSSAVAGARPNVELASDWVDTCGDISGCECSSIATASMGGDYLDCWVVRTGAASRFHAAS